MFCSLPRKRRALALASAFLATLSAGTNYGFSNYSSQLANRLGLSSVSLNLVGSAGNLGMYLSSPFVGTVIDGIGPTKPLLCASGLVFLGYGTLWHTYLWAPSDWTGLALAFLGNLLVGIGSSTALSSSANGVASSFHPSIRATVIGTALAGFGLSAFFWTTLGHLITSSRTGDTAHYLALLALAPPLLILVGALGCRPVNESATSQVDSHSPVDDRLDGADWCQDPARESVSEPTTPVDHPAARRELGGRALAQQKEFWVLWTIMGGCCGTTLMVINNLGTMAEALQESIQPEHDHTKLRAHQAMAVSVLSMFNCLGRIFAGALSDRLQAKYRLKRVWWLTWISILFVISQTLAYGFLKKPAELPVVSGLVGFAYGNIYGTAPVLLLDWFGLRHFTTNFGCLNLAPLLTGQLFNLSFGAIYDSHRHGTSLVCYEGLGCYRSAFLITIVACCAALGLSIFLALHQTIFQSGPDSAETRYTENRQASGLEAEPMLSSSSQIGP